MFKKIGSKVLENEPLSRHTTFGVGGPVRFWVEPEDAGKLKKVLSIAKKNGLKTCIIGAGSNILVSDNGLDAIAIHLGSPYYKKINLYKTGVRVGAGAMLERLVYLCCCKGLSGLEGLTGIPGTVGGAIYMNSSYRGSISDFLESVKVMDRFCRIRSLSKKDLKFGHRASNLSGYIILEATFKLKPDSRSGLLKRRKDLFRLKSRTQPLGLKSAGCVFKNPKNKPFNAAQLIEFSGLKGKRIGGAQISSRHANFIVNLRKARSSDIIGLIDMIRYAVNKDHHVKLTPEIRIL